MSIKVDSPGSAVLGLVALFCLLPSLVFALLAVRKAIHVRRPRSSASLPNVKFAVEMAQYHQTKEKLELNLWLIFHPVRHEGSDLPLSSKEEAAWLFPRGHSAGCDD